MKILITGGAGSLGKAFVRYLHKDHKVIVIDSNEWATAELDLPVEKILGDVSDYDFYHQPDLVIICHAYKHVNLGEENPESFINNNIVKTMQFMKRCNQEGVKFLFISTDKAVRPISLYGFTKAIGEKLALYFGGRVARLGNIISSSGSVIPLWEKAIESKQPIPITDERMVRYFIEENDAVRYIWDGYMNGDLIIIPPMEKIRILDLLTKVLQRHGYEKPDDYAPGIYTIGIRPGEKMVEELFWNEDNE